MKKKILSLLLAVVMLVSLTACSGLVKVIFAAAIISLLALGGYVFYMGKKGKK